MTLELRIKSVTIWGAVTAVALDSLDSNKSSAVIHVSHEMGTKFGARIGQTVKVDIAI